MDHTQRRASERSEQLAATTRARCWLSVAIFEQFTERVCVLDAAETMWRVACCRRWRRSAAVA